jgi:hypothetical protein
MLVVWNSTYILKREREYCAPNELQQRYMEGDKKLSQSDLSYRNCGAKTYGGGVKISQSDLSNINTCLELAP